MAGEESQETGQSHGYPRVSLNTREEPWLEGGNQVRKRQQALTLSGGNGKRKGTDTARPLFEVSEFLCAVADRLACSVTGRLWLH
jgi:hypothetical protein